MPIDDEVSLLLFAAIGFIAFAIRGVTGAASAIVFNALFGLALALGLAGDVTLLEGLYWIALADLLAVAVMLVILRREVSLEPFVRRLLAFTIPVTVVFVLLLPRVDTGVLTVGLSVVLITSGLYLGARRSLRTWSQATLRRRAAPTGVAAGALAGLYGMPGPVFVIFLAHAGGETRRFRARATVVSAVLSAVRVATLVASGEISSQTLVQFSLTIPVILVGLGLGLWLHPKVGPRAFRLGLGMIVVLAGSVLLVRTLLG